MFADPGSLGIFSIGLVAGFYFGRFFDVRRDLDVTGFVTLITVIGIGPSALALIRAYRDLNLLDPYGVGLLIGVVVNLIVAALLKATKPGEGRSANVFRALLDITGHPPLDRPG